MLFNASKTQFLHLSTRQNIPDHYPLYFADTHLPLSSTLNILGLSFTKTLNWKSHISSLAKSASKKLGVLCRLHQFVSLCQFLTLYSRPCMVYASHIWWVGGEERSSAHTELLSKVESKAFHLVDSPPLTDSLQLLTLRRNVASLVIFYRYFHA